MASKFSDVATFVGGSFAYDVGEGKVATLDVAKAFPSVTAMLPHEQAAFHFAVKAAARNARAGIKPGEVGPAFEAVTDRFKSWEEHKWRAASEKTGEGRTSLLARAVAEVLKIEIAEAVEQISGLIEQAVESAGLSFDEEGDKAKVRKIAKDVRENLLEATEVASAYKRLQIARLQAKPAGEGKTLTEVMKQFGGEGEGEGEAEPA